MHAVPLRNSTARYRLPAKQPPPLSEVPVSSSFADETPLILHNGMPLGWSSRIVYEAGRGEVSAVHFESRHANTIDYIRDAFRDDLAVEGNVLAAECMTFIREEMKAFRKRITPHTNLPKTHRSAAPKATDNSRATMKRLFHAWYEILVESLLN
jgi:hypothetical protein